MLYRACDTWEQRTMSPLDALVATSLAGSAGRHAADDFV